MHPKLGTAVAAITVMAAFVVLGMGSASSFAASTPPCPKPQKTDPEDFGGEEIDNPYFPLEPGTTFRYEGESGGEPAVDLFKVTNQTKTIVGVTTTVIKDSVYVNDELVEDTEDWFAQDADGNVWYFGEDTKEYENGQVVSTEGSWEAGVDGARAGIFMPAKPKVGQVFQQEFAKGVAEDCFKIVSLNASVEVPYVTSHKAMKTREWTRLDPEVTDTKWYVPDVGMVRDKGPDDELRLVSVED